jgi:hypothetical protein
MRLILFLTFMTGFIIISNSGTSIDPSGFARHAMVNADQGGGTDPDGLNGVVNGGGVTPDAGPRIDPEG